MPRLTVPLTLAALCAFGPAAAWPASPQEHFGMCDASAAVSVGAGSTLGASPIPIGVVPILIGVAYPHVPALASRSSVTTSPIRATSFVRSAPLTSTIT